MFRNARDVRVAAEVIRGTLGVVSVKIFGSDQRVKLFVWLRRSRGPV